MWRWYCMRCNTDMGPIRNRLRDIRRVPGGGMTVESIDKLREYGHDCCARVDDAIHGYADAIEEEISERYMPLPLDADGVPIRIGDVLDPPADCDDYVPLQVMRLMYDGYEQEWFFDGQAGGFCGMAGEHMDVAGWTHHHARTIEDVLDDYRRELVETWACTLDDEMTDAEDEITARYADEIRGMK